MLCVSIAPQTATLARVDLLNASRRADLVELCLDRLPAPIDLKELLSTVTKPVIVSCRTAQHGGHWPGSEDDRIALLRQAAAAGAAFVELDAESARHVPRVGNVRRIISFTSLIRALKDVPEKIDQAARLAGDVVKFTWPTPTLDEAWPLLAAASRRNSMPVVGIGTGAAGRLLSLLGRKHGSPWIYAALERGMEIYDGQPTIGELEDDYAWDGIGPKTEFVAVAGFGAGRQKSLRLLNQGCRNSGANFRCLPLEFGETGKLRQMLDLLHITRIISSRSLGSEMIPLAQHLEEAARDGNHVDLLLKRDDKWNGYSLIWRTTFRVLQRTLRRAFGKDAGLEGRTVLVLGAGHLAQALLYGLNHGKASALVASSLYEQEEVTFCNQCGASMDRGGAGAAQLADRMKVRHIPFSELGESQPDVVISADPSLELGYGAARLNPRWLKPPMVVVDATRQTEDSDLLIEARLRGCTVIRPSFIFAEEIGAQFQAITGLELPAEIFQEALSLD